MANGIFVTEIKNPHVIDVPEEVTNSLNLEEGDKVEVSLKKIRSKRMEIKISRNPLRRILDLKAE